MLLFYDSALVIDGRILAQHAINQWNHKQGGEGSQQQSADDGAPQRRVLFAAFPHAERHRQHAHDHGGGGHQDGPDAGVSGGKSGGARVHSLLALIVGEDHQQDAVGGGHADTHDGAHHGGHAEGGLGNE